MDDEGLLRVGGRITHSNLPADEMHPILLPGKHHVAVLLIRHHHGKDEQCNSLDQTAGQTLWVLQHI